MQIQLILSVPAKFAAALREESQRLNVPMSRLAVYLMSMGAETATEAQIKRFAHENRRKPLHSRGMPASERETLRILRAGGGWMPSKDIRKATNVSERIQSRALNNLVQGGFVEKRMLQGEHLPEMKALRARGFRGAGFAMWRALPIADDSPALAPLTEEEQRRRHVKTGDELAGMLLNSNTWAAPPELLEMEQSTMPEAPVGESPTPDDALPGEELLDRLLESEAEDEPPEEEDDYEG